MSLDNRHTSSMRTCMNIAATTWPMMSVPSVATLIRTRHSRPGSVFSLGQSILYKGESLSAFNANLDQPEVSR